MMRQRAFSFFSTEDAAEVQLGGYDPARYQHTLLLLLLLLLLSTAPLARSNFMTAFVLQPERAM